MMSARPEGTSKETLMSISSSTDDAAAITATLAAYQDALNRSDTEAVMALYVADGVFMPQYSPSSVGAAAVRRAYDAVFEAIALRVTFAVAEVVVVSANWAFARTNSSGTARANADGRAGPEANQELFVFSKVDDAWKIARYCFSTTNPPRA
jgi:uncharacterized protein (TIGR02246 family)